MFSLFIWQKLLNSDTYKKYLYSRSGTTQNTWKIKRTKHVFYRNKNNFVLRWIVGATLLHINIAWEIYLNATVF